MRQHNIPRQRASGQRRRRRIIISCAPHPLLPRRNIATCPTGDMNANNAAGGAAPAGGGAPPVAPAYPPLVVEAKPHYFVIGANLPPPFEVDPLGTKTTPHAPRVTSLNGPVPKEARIIGIHVEGRYVDSRQTDPLEFRSLLKSRAVHRKMHFIMVTRTPRPIGATEATLRAQRPSPSSTKFTRRQLPRLLMLPPAHLPTATAWYQQYEHGRHHDDDAGGDARVGQADC